MQAGRNRIAAGAALLLAVLAGSALAQPPLEEEQVHPSEVVFEEGRPYVHADGGMQALRTRQQDGQTVYYRMVRYDPQEGYVTTAADAGSPVAALAPRPFSAPQTPMRYHGAGHLYRPDFYNSPYNRDARQRYSGPGYFGSCSRYDGCKEVQVVPLWPYGRGY
ncbi:hypothetical protein [Stenotrophomonas mori]|uniref:Secreted protein n=1 Tax=Stenotrophomonas mori TaxID=2871096 RepID=A0ABT0SEK9_9GAMM|nr:hypothetical protein [Stenotrophomonas mori]MCL7713754.1 hypothetical protein [Stenotrophomonas mori]